MSEKPVLINFGGTLTMGTNADGLLEPIYSPEQFMLLIDILWQRSQGNIDPEEAEELLQELAASKLAGVSDVERALEDALDSAYGMDHSESGTGMADRLLRNLLEQSLTQQLGETITPIDSINFSFEEHYPALLEGVCKALNAGHPVILFGGTDSMQHYSAMLATDLKRRGYCQPDSGQHVTIASSMLSFEESPAHVGNIMNAAMDIAVDGVKRQHVDGTVFTQGGDGNPYGAASDCAEAGLIDGKAVTPQQAMMMAREQENAASSHRRR